MGYYKGQRAIYYLDWGSGITAGENGMQITYIKYSDTECKSFICFCGKQCSGSDSVGFMHVAQATQLHNQIYTIPYAPGHRTLRCKRGDKP